MEPALKNGEHAFAEAYTGTPDPPRGEIIVFRYPLQPKTVFAKRVVAVPGDKVQIVKKELYVNGAVPNEAYATHLDPNIYDDPTLPEPYKSRDNFGPVTLAADEFFVLGDNRDSSSDSRYWGAVPRANIVGRVVSAGDVSGSLRSVH